MGFSMKTAHEVIPAANANRWAARSSMAIEDFIKHGPHCLAGKYSTIGRCSCGAQEAFEEMSAIRKAVQQSMHQTGLTPAQKEEVRQMIQSALDTGSA
jgi:hypothetical protein